MKNFFKKTTYLFIIVEHWKCKQLVYIFIGEIVWIVLETFLKKKLIMIIVFCSKYYNKRKTEDTKCIKKKNIYLIK